MIDIDIFIVFAYLSVLLFIGIYQKSKQSGFKGFARISDKVNKSKLMLVATIFVSSIGGGTTFGIAEKAFAGNIAYSYALMLVIPLDILIAIYLVPRIIKYHGAESIGDIISVHYGNIGRFISGISAMCVSVGFLAAQISVSGRIFEYILQMDYIKGVVLSYTIVVIYTTIGGLRSVFFTNQLQFFAILIAIPIISIFGIYGIGVAEFLMQIPLKKVSIVNNPDLIQTTIYAALGFAVMNLFPTYIQRVLINKDPSQTAKAIYIKSAIYFIFLIFVTLNGIIAYITYPEIAPRLALPYLIDHIIPIGLQGVVVVGLLAAVMSTADSDLNISAITLVKDIINPIWKIKNPERMLKIARFANIIIGSFAILISLCFETVVDLVIFVAGFWGPIVLVPLVFALYDITIKTKFMALSSICGAIAFIAWEFIVADSLSLKGVFVGTLVNIVLFLLSKPKKDWNN